jgi:DNA-binding transcriptional regulator YhcF (GntR family)
MQLSPTPDSESTEKNALSYKFQRLREKLREAVANGELTGKLPGERLLAKRFHVNAKTLSKALTDLAAEGLLDRSIGRGTFVKGTVPSAVGTKRWLIICDTVQLDGELVKQIRNLHNDIELVTDMTAVRPSFINQFSAVIDLSTESRDAMIRDLVVRNIPLVVVGQKPYTFSTHAVQCDYALAVTMAGRDLLLAGHRRIAAVEPRVSSFVASNLRTAVARYSPQATIDACFPEDVPAMIESGVTAFVCGSCEIALAVKAQLGKQSYSIPAQVSLMAVGISLCEPPCSGYFVDAVEKAAAIVQLLGDSQNSRPTTIWLTGKFSDQHTTAPLLAIGPEHGMHYRDLAS